MTSIQHTLRMGLMAIAFFAFSAHAATDLDVAQTTENSAAHWTGGEIRKLDKDSGKVTIRHEDIKNLNMPAMTMVFVVKNKQLLDGLKVGDKIQFKAEQEQGKLIVTDIKAGQEAAMPTTSGTEKEGMKSGRNMKSTSDMLAKMEKHIEHMREMVQKWDAAQTPEARQALMQEHHRMMHEGMEMSPKKGDQHQH